MTFECQPVPCPQFEEAELKINGICDCRDHNTPGNPNCCIHGESVRAWIDGYSAATAVFKATYSDMYRGLPYYGAAK